MAKVCIICGSENFKIKSEKFCSIKCLSKHNIKLVAERYIICEICSKKIRKCDYKKHLKKHNKEQKILNTIFKCECCGVEFYGKLGNTNRFCSKKCARAFSTKAKRKEINEKVSKTIIKRLNAIGKFGFLTEEFHKSNKNKNKNNIIHKKYYSIYDIESEKECPICHNKFKTKNINKLTCSKECGWKLGGLKNLGSHHIVKDSSKMGGLRPGGGKSKQILYINWLGFEMSLNKEEIEVAKILDEKRLNWNRNTKGFPYITLDGKNKKYYPDFVINKNKYIEYKGWITEEMEHKMKDAKEKNNLNLTIVVGNDKRYKNYGLTLNELKNLVM